MKINVNAKTIVRSIFEVKREKNRAFLSDPSTEVSGYLCRNERERERIKLPKVGSSVSQVVVSWKRAMLFLTVWVNVKTLSSECFETKKEPRARGKHTYLINYESK